MGESCDVRSTCNPSDVGLERGEANESSDHPGSRKDPVSEEGGREQDTDGLLGLPHQIQTLAFASRVPDSS